MPPVPNSHGSRPPRRIRMAALPLVLLAGLMVLAGCSSARDAGGPESGVPVPGIVQEGDRVAPGSPGDDAAGGGGTENLPPDAVGVPEGAPPGSATLPEQIVRTGDVSVDVEDITSAANRVTAVVNAAGGDVGSDTRYGNATDGSADLVLRVPPDAFADILETVSGLGEEVSRSVSAEDVSTIVADVDARVRSLQNSVDRLLALAAQAVSIGDLIAIESELSARQGELESLQAQQRALADQVGLATLSVHLSATSEPEEPDNGFVASLKAGWDALLDAGRVVTSLVGLLLPWLALFVVLVVPLWILIRRRRASPALAGAGAPGAPSISEPATSEPSRPPE